MPLSIGLFGEWGSGKSYFMGLLRGQVKTLADSGSAVYCENIHPIGFNAWHYADTNLWASLADEIFDQLAGPRNPLEHQRKAIERELIEEGSARKQLEAAVERGAQETAWLQAKVKEAEAARMGSARELLKAASKAPTFRRELNAAWRRLGVQGDEGEQARRLAEQLRGPSSENDDLRQVLRAFGGRAVITATVVVLLAGLVAFALGRWYAGGGLTGVATVIGIACLAVRWISSGFDKLRAIASEIQANPPDAEQLAALRQAETAEQVLQAQLDEVIERLGALGRDLTNLSPGRRLYTFVTERAEGQEYRSHLGLVSTIRKDFEQLVALMNDWRDRRDKDEEAPLPIDRIVLYIDDLDRCSPRQVVDVLQAVHLLLAFELFVVVVGVDPRWLVRSLQSQYAELLSAVDDTGAERWQATPQDYLEKIFNIPFALPRMSQGSFGQLLGTLARDGDHQDVERDAHVDGAPPGAEAMPHDLAEWSGTEPPPDEITVEPESPVHAISRGKPPRTEVRPMSDNELQMLTALAPLVGTPREAKRLVNLYRMIRATRDLSTASDFLGEGHQAGEYQAVAILLGMVSAYGQLLDDVLNAPSLDRQVRGGLLNRKPATTWTKFVADSKPRHDTDDGTWRNRVGNLQPKAAPAWLAQYVGLTNATALVTLEGLNAFQVWAPRVVRFSFLHSLHSTETDFTPPHPAETA